MELNELEKNELIEDELVELDKLEETPEEVDVEVETDAVESAEEDASDEAEQKPQLSLETTEEIIEAMLFAAGHPVTYEKIADILETTPKAVKEILTHYEQIYNTGSTPRGVQLLMYENACQLCTKSEYERYVKLALGIRQGKGSLSNSSLEVLAIIAYHQPVTRAYIEQVRGVDSSYAVAVLQEKNLIEKKGKLDVPGRPSLYGTTLDFLRCFGLNSLDQLPPVELLDLESLKTEETESTTEIVTEEATSTAE